MPTVHFIVFERNLFSCECIKAREGRKFLFAAASLGTEANAALHVADLLGSHLGFKGKIFKGNSKVK